MVVRQIQLRKGGCGYAVDQGDNPALACLRPSGQLAPELLIAGSVDTFARSSYSGRLFQAFRKLLQQRSRRIGSFWVGPLAEEKLRLGWRLVTNASAPRQYDLTVAQAPPATGDATGGALAQKG